ncbi:VanZ family protein [Alicyclobacillus fodiniaquatilis]|uniref:VanZ family protein n=1 Tax=Alicyclobacillus fodiniaquatilis TaxID=1661150 RepID=A0ABW4JEE4_9BACL
MLTITPFAVVATVLYLILAIGFGFKKKVSIWRQVLSLLFFAYLLVVVDITLFPIPYTHNGGDIQANNLIPFKTIMAILKDGSLSNDFSNIGGNVLLFAPFGFLIPLLFRKQNSYIKILLLGFLGTLCVESSQFMISAILGFTYRSFDVDDLICNTVGTLIGYAILRVCRYLGQKRMWVKLSPILAVVVVGGILGYEYTSHSTPERAQESMDSNVLPLVTVPLSKGVVLVTPTDPKTTTKAGYEAWYFEKSGLLGWRLKATSIDELNHSVSSLTANEQTFIWGVTGNSNAESVLYRTKGKFYKSSVNAQGIWDIVLPFTQNISSGGSLSLVLHNGKTDTLAFQTNKNNEN